MYKLHNSREQGSKILFFKTINLTVLTVTIRVTNLFTSKKFYKETKRHVFMATRKKFYKEAKRHVFMATRKQ